MKPGFLIISILMILCSCNTGTKSRPKPFTPDILARQLFEINNNRDTTLITLHGSTIRITAGTFGTLSDISIEIKEAFTPAEIMLAGLTTISSDGRLLRSDGMIYINATNDGNITQPVKPISITIPVDSYEPEMLLFKGAESDSGDGITWTDPQPLDTSDFSDLLATGEAIFRSTCGSCHRIFLDLTGPALRDFRNRGPWNDFKKLERWIKNPAAFMAGDPYTSELKQKYKSVMQPFPDLDTSSIKAISAYIMNESSRPGAEEEERIGKSEGKIDSASYSYTPMQTELCRDTVLSPPPAQNLSFMFFNTDIRDQSNNDTLPEIDPRVQVEPSDTPSPAYEFKVTLLGWYNIDMLMNENIERPVVKIEKILTGDTLSNMTTYVLVPKQKLYVPYYALEVDNLPLLPGEDAFMIAIGEKNEEIHFGISKFIIKPEQQIRVDVKRYDLNSFTKEIADLRIDSVNLNYSTKGLEISNEQKELKISQRICVSMPDTVQ